MGLTNVEVVLSTYTDTNLPDNTCDVAFVLDTYHHFEWPPAMLDAMKRDLKQGGRLVIVDWYRRQNAIFDKLGTREPLTCGLPCSRRGIAESTRNEWSFTPSEAPASCRSCQAFYRVGRARGRRAILRYGQPH